MQNRLYTYFVLAISTIYLTLAIYGKSVNAEIFPFFHWSLFSVVPNRTEQSTIEVISIDGKPINGSGDVFKNPKLLRIPKINASIIINKWYNALMRDPVLAKEIQSSIETSVIPSRSEYILVRETFMPLQKWRDNEVIERRIVGRFKNGQQIFDGHQTDMQLEKGSLTINGASLKIIPIESKIGYVDRILMKTNEISVIGWAANTENGSLPDRVVVFYDGSFVANAFTGALRADVSRAFQMASIEKCGYSASFKLDSKEKFNYRKLQVIYIKGVNAYIVPFGSRIPREWKD